ncbi:MAG: flagellar hook-basal body complex protein FliE [Bacteroidetes bacterium]|jgi:flagellar hook-basal body complex protein FliE|nr:flagellar hook-basal body complex protein FliE [Bacteroidota bacterium]HOV98545.1 flagellar hook-basal body complex protein FliE [Bacteroidota bacterium]
MKINQNLTLLPNIDSKVDGRKINKTLEATNESFGEMLSQAITDVNRLQSEAGKAVENMVKGEETDIHNVMIAVEKARTSFDLLMEVRNKTIDMYRELMRMQV